MATTRWLDADALREEAGRTAAEAGGPDAQAAPWQLIERLAALEAAARWSPGEGVGAALAEATSRLIGSLEDAATRPQPPRIRLGIIATGGTRSTSALLRSLAAAAARTGWARRHGGLSCVTVMVLHNHDGPGLEAGEVPTGLAWHERRCAGPHPRPIGAARAQLVAWASEETSSLGPDAPFWWLDDDFRFEELVPASPGPWTVDASGYLLHRLEAACRLRSGDVISFGCSGAPPVPALALVGPQWGDLASSSTERWSSATLRAYGLHPDPYYALGPNHPEALQVPVARETRALLASHEGVQTLAHRMLHGLPVTRPVAASLLDAARTLDGTTAPPTALGGNTLILDARALRPDLFHVARWNGLPGRRSDAAYATELARLGLRVVQGSLPLHHSRQPSSHPPSALLAQARRDVVGYGLQQATRALPASDPQHRALVAAHAERRRIELAAHVGALLARLESPPGAGLATLAAHLRDALEPVRTGLATPLEPSDVDVLPALDA